MPQYVVRAVNLPADPFTRGFLECAEWAGLSDSDAYCEACGLEAETGGECEDCGADIFTTREAFEDCAAPRWSPGSLTRAAEDCEAFKRDNAADLEGADMAQAGHDFYLTRNRHGAGFWDGDYPKDVGDRLTAACRPYGETYEWFNTTTGMIETTPGYC